MKCFLYIFLPLLIKETSASNTILLTFNNSANLEYTIQQKCERNGGENAFNKLTNASLALLEVLVENFEYSTILKEVEGTQRKQLLNKVFQTFCQNNQQYKKRRQKLFIATKSCISIEEQPLLHLANNIIEETIAFTCYKNGERIAMFIEEGGFECLANKSGDLQICLSDVFVIEPQVFITSDDYLKVHKCIVRVLDGCADVTAANMIDALMKKIYKLEP